MGERFNKTLYWKQKKNYNTLLHSETVKDITLELTQPRNDIRAFSIYGRNFQRDGNDVTTGAANSFASLAFVTILSAVLLIIFERNI